MERVEKRRNLLLPFLLGCLAIFAWVIFWNESFNAVMAKGFFFAALLGFLKLFFFGTFGEMVKAKISKKTWAITKPVTRALVWGLIYGVWFTVAFPGFHKLVVGLIDKGYWWSGFPAFSKSLWINVVGGYAFWMMLTHKYCDECIEKGRIISPKAFCLSMNWGPWIYFIVCTLPVWIVIHTVTYSLPGQYQVLFAAGMATVLGGLLAWANTRSAPVKSQARMKLKDVVTGQVFVFTDEPRTNIFLRTERGFDYGKVVGDGEKIDWHVVWQPIELGPASIFERPVQIVN